MNAKELFQAGQLAEAIKALGVEVRDNPADARRRTFLFELLCFSGDWERAAKQLSVLASENKQTDMGSLLYKSALHADRQRHETFEKRDFPLGEVPEDTRGGKWTDAAGGEHTFETLEDADPRLGARLELFAAGAYLWIPFAHVERIETQKPSRLRDLIWPEAIVRTGPAFKATELGQVLLPVICPFSFKNADGNVALGRSTVWEDVDGETLPFGQKMFVIDGEDVPMLDVRVIEFNLPADSADSEGSAERPTDTRAEA